MITIVCLAVMATMSTQVEAGIKIVPIGGKKKCKSDDSDNAGASPAAAPPSATAVDPPSPAPPA